MYKPVCHSTTRIVGFQKAVVGLSWEVQDWLANAKAYSTRNYFDALMSNARPEAPLSGGISTTTYYLG